MSPPVTLWRGHAMLSRPHKLWELSMHFSAQTAKVSTPRITMLRDGPNAWTRLRLSKPGVSDSDLAKFDLALTVCVMRYVSDLYIGKVNPRTFHFGLDIEHKKYNLPDF